MSDSLRVLHVTDTHLFADPSVSKNGINTYKSLCSVLDQALVEDTPDLVIGGGDIAQEAVEVTYERFRSAIRDRVSCEFLCVPGNHDTSDLFNRILPVGSREFEHWCVVGLDTHKDHTVSGNVSDTSYTNLLHELEKTTKHKLVVGHHPLTKIGVDWLDGHRVDNGDMVMDTLVRDPTARIYLSGHVHQEFSSCVNEVETYTTPSTCWQFATNSLTFAFDKLAPGWRWLTLNRDGSIETHVSRIEEGTHEHSHTQ